MRKSCFVCLVNVENMLIDQSCEELLIMFGDKTPLGVLKGSKKEERLKSM